MHRGKRGKDYIISTDMAKKKVRKKSKPVSHSAKKKASQPPQRKPSASPKKKAPSRKSSINIPPHLKTPLTHLTYILGAFILISIYFQPVFQGQDIQMGDIQSFSGMTQEVRDYRETTGEEAYWTTSMFSGMPTYHLGLQYPANWWNSIRKVYFDLVPSPISFVLLYFLGFYLLLNVLGVKPELSAIGAIAFAFSSYFFIILKAGHTSKAAAIGFMAPILAGIILAYRGKILLGAVLAAVFTALEIASNHFQITYYLLLVILVIGIAYGVDAIREKTIPQFLKASGVLLIAGLLGVGPNIGMLWTTSEYASETIRGKSELSPQDGEPESSGLDKEYALGWSYGQAETFTLLIPNFHGGASNTKVSRNTDAYRQLRADRLPTYWGGQPFTEGPVYVGAIIVFLFLLGALVVKGPLKWGLVAATILSILLAWGKNLEWFTDLFFYNVPLYNKFRAVTMILVIAEMTMPLLGMLGLHHLIKAVNSDTDTAKLARQTLIAGGVTGGLSLIFWLIGPTLFDFTGYNDSRFQQQVVDILLDLRMNMFRADALRAFLLIGVSTGTLWLYIQQRLKLNWVLAILGVLIVGDMWAVNKRYLDRENFSRRENYETPAPSPASQFILQNEAELHYRVLNLSTNPFENSQMAFFHHCIGGYHAAKLRRYQDLIDRRLRPEIQQFGQALNALQNDTTGRSMMFSYQEAFQNLHTLNMLNARYFITDPQQRPLENPYTMGNAWFVGQMQMVPNADEEMATIQDFDPAETAVIDQRFQEQLSGFQPVDSTTGTINLTDYSPNQLTYTSNSNQEQLAIFSEIYYNDKKGWKAYIDNQEVPHFRANYVLRGLRVPAGEHMIVFRMEPKSYFLGETISLIASIILLLVVLGFFGWTYWQQRNADNDLAEDENTDESEDKSDEA